MLRKPIRPSSPTENVISSIPTKYPTTPKTPKHYRASTITVTPLPTPATPKYDQERKINSTNDVYVVCRVRPVSSKERYNELGIDNVNNSIGFKQDIRSNNGTGHVYNFDQVFDSNANQVDVFQFAENKILPSFIEGYSGSVLVYGQTGSGKTHTIFGNNNEPGLVPNIFTYVFDNLPTTGTVNLTISCCEIYCEQIFDLLDLNGNALDVREKLVGPGQLESYVENLSENKITNCDEAMENLNKAFNNRHVSSTKMNHQSSRSHTIFTLNLFNRQMRDGREVVRVSKLVLVDLAGSERLVSVLTVGERLEETKHINLSLSELGKVINQLTNPNYNHIQFRNSVLTRLLKNSLLGAKTMLIATISPAICNAAESEQTLRFAEGAKHMRKNVKLNEVVIEDPVLLKKKINELEAEMASLKQNSIGSVESETFLENVRNMVDLLKESSEQLLSSQLGIQHYRSFWNYHKDEFTKMIEHDHSLISNIEKDEITPYKNNYSSSPRAELIRKLRPIVRTVRNKLLLSPSNWQPANYDIEEQNQYSEYQRLLNQNIKLSAFITRLFREYPELSKHHIVTDSILLDTPQITPNTDEIDSLKFENASLKNTIYSHQDNLKRLQYFENEKRQHDEEKVHFMHEMQELKRKLNNSQEAELEIRNQFLSFQESTNVEKMALMTKVENLTNQNITLLDYKNHGTLNSIIVPHIVAPTFNTPLPPKPKKSQAVTTAPAYRDSFSVNDLANRSARNTMSYGSFSDVSGSTPVRHSSLSQPGAVDHLKNISRYQSPRESTESQVVAPGEDLQTIFNTVVTKLESQPALRESQSMVSLVEPLSARKVAPVLKSLTRSQSQRNKSNIQPIVNDENFNSMNSFQEEVLKGIRNIEHSPDFSLIKNPFTNSSTKIMRTPRSSKIANIGRKLSITPLQIISNPNFKILESPVDNSIKSEKHVNEFLSNFHRI